MFYPRPIFPPVPKLWPRSRKIGILAALVAVPVLLILRAGFRSLRQRRRARNGLCPQCAYDLRFSPERCPECGTPISANITHGLIRKCVARMVLTLAIIIVLTTAVFWIRSYRVADCWVRTTAERTDSIYFSRGGIMVNLLTIAGQHGWSHQRADPAAFPRSMAESGDLPCWNVLGIEYSSLSQMLIVPMWSLIAVSSLCGGLMVRTLRSRQIFIFASHGRRFRASSAKPTHRPGSKGPAHRR